MTQGGILALDLGTKTGWAYGYPRAEPEWGKVSFGSESDGDVFFALACWLDEGIQARQPKYVCTEQPWISPKFSPPIKLIGMDAIVQLVTRKHNLRFRSWAVKEVAKFFLGEGGLKSAAKKIATQEMCLRYGWRASQDECDALALWCFAEAKLDPGARRSLGPLFQPAAAN